MARSIGEVNRLWVSCRKRIQENDQQSSTWNAEPMETEQLIAAGRGHQDVAAQIYAASLLAIEVDTPAEKAYLEQLADGLKLAPEVTQQIRGFAGVPTA